MEKVHLQLKYVFDKSAFYSEKLKGYFDPNQIEFTLEDYKKIPFTTKEDLANYNDLFLCVPYNKIAEYATTSGTSGNPVTLYLTKSDLARLAQNEFDSFSLMGCNSDDVFQLMTTIDKQFMAGLAYYLGVQKLDAGLVRIGPGVPQLQIESIFKYKPTKIIAVPSFIVSIIKYAQENNIELNNSSVNSIICIGEPIRNDDFTLNLLGEKIVSNWNVSLFSTYASTEMGAAFSECTEQKGTHLNEDLLFLEVLKEDGLPATDGEEGEVIITTLGVTGTPLVRYRTGDIARLHTSACRCGKKSLRLGPIIGRKNQMIKYKGTTIFPKAIYDILDQFSEIKIYKVQISKDSLGNDDIKILLDDILLDDINLNSLEQKCKANLKVIPNFDFINHDELFNMIHQKHIRKPLKIEFI